MASAPKATSPKASVAAGALGAAGGQGRPERGPADDGQQGRQQGEGGQQHDRYCDGQWGAEAGVQSEGGQHQREQGGNDGRGGERDRLADPGQGAGDRVVRGAAGPEFLPDPEYEEEAVVGAGAEGQDEQHDLGQRGYRQAGLARLADYRPGELGDQHGGDEGQ